MSKVTDIFSRRPEKKPPQTIDEVEQRIDPYDADYIAEQRHPEVGTLENLVHEALRAGNEHEYRTLLGHIQVLVAQMMYDP